MKHWVALTGALTLLAVAGGASAADITQTFTLSADNFIPYFGSTPIDPLQAVFTITYDPTVETDPTSVGITADSANFPTLTPEFTFIPGFDYMVIGTKPTVGGGFLTSNNGDYGFFINTSENALILTQYIAIDGSGEYYSQSGTVSISGGVPEPSAWALGILGVGLAGAMLRGRRRRVPEGARA